MGKPWSSLAIYRQIETAWLANHSDIEAFQEELRAFGGTLLDELIPRKIQHAWWKVRDTLRSIMVLAEKGLVRWLYDAPHAPQQLIVRTDHSHYVIPDYVPQALKLPMAQAEIPFLEKTFGAQPVQADENVIRKRLRVPDAVDLFHFSGHGEAGNHKVLEARILMHGVTQLGKWNARFLEVKTITHHARLSGPLGVRPMIMLNACQVGRQDWRLTSIGGFADAFLRRGAGTFVGSLWSVGGLPDKPGKPPGWPTPSTVIPTREFPLFAPTLLPRHKTEDHAGCRANAGTAVTFRIIGPLGYAAGNNTAQWGDARRMGN